MSNEENEEHTKIELPSLQTGTAEVGPAYAGNSGPGFTTPTRHEHPSLPGTFAKVLPSATEVIYDDTPLEADPYDTRHPADDRSMSGREYRYKWDEIDQIRPEELYGKINLVMGGGEHVTIVGATIPYAEAVALRDYLLRELTRSKHFRNGFVEFLIEENEGEEARGYSYAVAYIELEQIIGMTMQVLQWPEGAEARALLIRP